MNKKNLSYTSRFGITFRRNPIRRLQSSKSRLPNRKFSFSKFSAVGSKDSHSVYFAFFFSSRRRHTSCYRDWSSDVCSSDLYRAARSESHAAERVRFAAGFGGIGGHQRCRRRQQNGLNARQSSESERDRC